MMEGVRAEREHKKVSGDRREARGGGGKEGKLSLGLHPTYHSVVSFFTATTSVVNRPNFKVGMKLEAVDQRFPYFVCVATVMDKSGR